MLLGTEITPIFARSACTSILPRDLQLWLPNQGTSRLAQHWACRQHSAWAPSSSHRPSAVVPAFNKRARGWNNQGGGAAPDPESLTYDAALGRALHLVNYRDRTAHELQQKLLEDGYTAEIAREAVEHVQSAGLQSDERYAELYARGHWRRTLRAPVRIRMELQAKGVPSPLIEAALQKVFGSSRAIRPSDLSSIAAAEGVDAHEEAQWTPADSCDDEDVDEDAAREHDAWVLILQEARKRAAMSTGEPADKRKAKLARWLQSRGHAWDTVSNILAALKL